MYILCVAAVSCVMIESFLFALFYRGISVDHILINFLKIYCDPASLVLVINTSTQEEVTETC